jgi:hypothetical protein
MVVPQAGADVLMGRLTPLMTVRQLDQATSHCPLPPVFKTTLLF